MNVNWTRESAAHLLRRAGFGGTPAEIDALHALGLEGAVSYLVDYEAIDVSAYEAELAARGYNQSRISGLQQWFMDRMAFSPRPLEEKMTYFWNLHWTSGIAKVRGETLLLNQNQTERRLAMARFDDLVVAISQDPAMLVWLDNATNRVGRPNENYARELMELFCLGIGHYGEEDVREVARALTGWTVANYNRDTGYNAATFVDRPAVPRRGLEDDPRPDRQFRRVRRDRHHPRPYRRARARSPGGSSARSSGPTSPARMRRRTSWIRCSRSTRADHSVREVVRAILLAPEFYEAHTRKTWVRSPVEYAVASVRMLEGTSDFSAAANALAGMGQVLFNPADAKGWDWGVSWMNTGSLFARASLANTLSTNRGAAGTRFDPDAMLAGQDASTAEGVVDALAARLNVDDVSGEIRDAWIDYVSPATAGALGIWTNTPEAVDEKVRGLVHVMLTSPAFHLA